MIGIIPAAGKGTRMGSVTDGQASKEMLPLGGRPVIAWVIEEALAAGCASLWVVSHSSKTDLNHYLEADWPQVNIVWQEEQSGLGFAVTTVEGPGSALVLLADTIFLPSMVGPAQDSQSWVLAEEVDPDQASKFGMIRFADPEGQVEEIVEKPEPAEVPSLQAVAARYFLTSAARNKLRDAMKIKLATHGETGLTELLNEVIKSGEKLMARSLPRESRRFDCGSPSGYEEAKRAVAEIDKLSRMVGK